MRKFGLSENDILINNNIEFFNILQDLKVNGYSYNGDELRLIEDMNVYGDTFYQYENTNAIAIDILFFSVSESDKTFKVCSKRIRC